MFCVFFEKEKKMLYFVCFNLIRFVDQLVIIDFMRETVSWSGEKDNDFSYERLHIRNLNKNTLNKFKV